MKSDISGFPEFLPNEQIVFNSIVERIGKYFESYGFVPMDTPAVERISTLLSKGDDNEIYGLYRIADENYKKDLGLRFDLTVPLARYISSKYGSIIFPHKRYQIAPVWRGERSQFGRYRQFYQCDIDIVGNEELSIAHDAEVLKVITEVLHLLNIPSFTTKINNRKILSGFLKTIVDESKVLNTIKAIDVIDKIGESEFDNFANSIGIDSLNFNKLKNFLNFGKKVENINILKWMKSLNFNPEFNEGVSELEEVINLLKRFSIEDNDIKISTKLARGLTYYTGNVFETTMDEFEDAGSIAGGGRYENLVSTISDKKIPGIGASIGITRLLVNLFERGYITCKKSSTAKLLVTVQNRKFIASYMGLSEKFRKLGINTETYLQEKSLGHQLSYASRKGIKYALIANDMELLEDKAIIRNLETKEQTIIKTKHIAESALDLLK